MSSSKANLPIRLNLTGYKMETIVFIKDKDVDVHTFTHGDSYS